MDAPTHCDKCGRPIVKPDGIGTGYATVYGPGERGVAYCYPCADDRSRADMAAAQPGDRFGFYVSSDGRRLTTWTGGELGSVTWGKRHPWSPNRRYMTVTDPHGRTWFGTGAPDEWSPIRLRVPS